MKINREARHTAKKLFKLAFANGQLDESRVREIVNEVSTGKPRNYLAILERFAKLVEIEVDQKTVQVLSATDLPDRGASVFAAVEEQCGPALNKEYAVRPALLGGLRIQRGSDVWDGSIRARLDNLYKSVK